ncbi:membrane protein [Mycobacterium phage Kumao]|uniref:Membrane protein n=1 Tax=Mycobacterium phage Kumao TaxID=2041344 RepID=A0A2D1GPT7_9CAUD|nr:membrane protein [Mycobacterium phage Kumao]ATN94059.1 membrane protein [Mycobacterium phage Kumao]
MTNYPYYPQRPKHSRNTRLALTLAVVLAVLIGAVLTHQYPGLAILGLGVATYLVPTFIAQARQSHLLGPVVVINLLLGWTFVGWVVALAMAVKNR